MNQGDYVTLSLTEHCNAGLALLGDTQPAPVGLQLLRGLPFAIGSDPERCFVGFGARLRREALAIPIGSEAWNVIVAHRLLDSAILEGGPIGTVIAEYQFHYRDGTVDRIPVRDRFEIATVPDMIRPASYRLGKGSWGQLPFRAVQDRFPDLPPRSEGPFSRVGSRQMEVIEESSAARGYFLWGWRNPRPEIAVERLVIVPGALRFLVAGITLGFVDENPLVIPPALPVRIAVIDSGPRDWAGDLLVNVDRGMATFIYPLPGQSVEEFLADPLAGFGQAPNPNAAPAYVRIAALPSATVTLSRNGAELAEATWADLSRQRAVVRNGVRLEITESGRNWVRTIVVDDATGTPVPCRIHFRSPQGIPYQPQGHQDHITGDLDTWHIDVGGDLRLGQTTYAYIDGTCQGWLPRGRVVVDVARGYEYEPLRTQITIHPGQQELTLHLNRFADLNRQRWFAGDTHAHFLSTQGSHLEARAEGLNVVNLLQAQWGHLFTSTEEFTGRPSLSSDGQTIVYVSQENRQHMLGHLILLGLKRPVTPWSSDGPSEAEVGGSLETTLSEWADQCHAQGGTVIIPHFPNPNGEAAALVATGRADAAEMVVHGLYYHLEYYRYLNCGYQLPLAGGSDKMSNATPVGIFRTYVHVPADEEFTYQSWCRNLAAGHTFITSGPLLSFTVDGRMIGDTIHLPEGGGTVEVEAHVQSIFPIQTLEVLQQGQVVAAAYDQQGTRKLRLKERIVVNQGSWLAARAGAAPYFRPTRHLDDWARGIMAHTSPIYIACGESWVRQDRQSLNQLLLLVDGARAYVRELSSQYTPGTVSHHHGQDNHLAYLERPFLEARAALEARLLNGLPAKTRSIGGDE